MTKLIHMVFSKKQCEKNTTRQINTVQLFKSVAVYYLPESPQAKCIILAVIPRDAKLDEVLTRC